MASVQCAVTKGDYPLEIVWMFANKPIELEDQGVIISESGRRAKQLTIEAVMAKHAGEYTCVASNAAGSTSRSVLLAVNGIIYFHISFLES